MKVWKTVKAALVTAALSSSMLFSMGAQPAHAASLVCTGGDGCSHQTLIRFDNTDYDATHEWWGPFTVLKMQTDGNLVLYCQGQGSTKPVWSSGTNTIYPGLSDALFQSSGNLSLWRTYGTVDRHATWVSRTDGHAGNVAIVQADGNFVIWSSTGQALWASNTYHQCPGTQGYWTGYR